MRCPVLLSTLIVAVCLGHGFWRSQVSGILALPTYLLTVRHTLHITVAEPDGSRLIRACHCHFPSNMNLVSPLRVQFSRLDNEVVQGRLT